MRNNAHSGFTLVELAIALVIIGLVAGGVLVGRDLIRASEIRATISQLEQYNSAVHTFRTKYGGLPGDLKYTEASGFGLYAITYAPYIGYPGYGDGNGLIRSALGAAPPSAATNLYGEPLIFWRHLTQANLIRGRYGFGLNIAAEAAVSGIDSVNTFLPAAKLTGSTIAVGSPLDGKNYFLLTKVSSIVGAGAFGTSENPLTAHEAYSMDSKIDDGLPAAGIVFAIDGTGNLNSRFTWTTVSAVGDCVVSSAYALTQNTQSCSLRIKFQ